MRRSGTPPTGPIAQHPANANFRSYLLQGAHKHLLPVIKPHSVSLQRVSLIENTQGNKDFPDCLLHNYNHYRQASSLPSPHATPKPLPFPADCSQSTYHWHIHTFPIYASIFNSLILLYMVQKSRALCLFCSLMDLQTWDSHPTRNIYRVHTCGIT